MDAVFRMGKPKRSFAENGSPQTAVSLAEQVSVVIPYAVSGRKGVKDHARRCAPDMNGWRRFKAPAQPQRIWSRDDKRVFLAQAWKGGWGTNAGI
jgi:hypothetical protein